MMNKLNDLFMGMTTEEKEMALNILLTILLIYAVAWGAWIITKDIKEDIKKRKLEKIEVKEESVEKNVEVVDVEEINNNEDGHMNLFKTPMTEQEQLELSDLLDDFMQVYENNFFEQLTDNAEESANELEYEFRGLYKMLKMLEDRACDLE